MTEVVGDVVVGYVKQAFGELLVHADVRSICEAMSLEGGVVVVRELGLRREI
jgi:hypothetical protein